jgi:dTMP kinase
MAGRFISFEGGEGAGKSTQIRRLAARLTSVGQRVVVTREPGGTPTAETIRRHLLSGRAETLGAEGEAILFAAARADHVENLIRPALARGDWVLSDRFIDSTRVYQGIVGGVDEALLDSLERVSVGPTRPDLTIILDVPADIGFGRAAARMTASGERPDRFEGEAIAVYEARRQGFLKVAAREPWRCLVIDAAKGEEVVAERVWEAVKSRFLDAAA